MSWKLVMITAFSAATVLAGASLPARADNETIAVFTKDQANPYFQIVRYATDFAARSMNAKTIQYVPSKPGNIEEQANEIEDAVTNHVSAMVLIPMDFRALAPSIKKANAAKIPLIDFLDHWQEGEYVAYVGIDNFVLAHAVAERLFQAMHGKGNIIILEGPKGVQTSVDREGGFRKALAEFPNIKLLASQTANYQKLQGLQVTENLAQRFPNINGVLAENDAMALGAGQALQASGQEALLAGINGTPEAVSAIQKGEMLVSGDYNAFTTSCLATLAAIRDLRHMPVPKEINLPPHLIDATNYKDSQQPVDQRKCGTWEQLLGQG